VRESVCERESACVCERVRVCVCVCVCVYDERRKLQACVCERMHLCERGCACLKPCSMAKCVSERRELRMRVKRALYICTKSPVDMRKIPY